MSYKARRAESSRVSIFDWTPAAAAPTVTGPGAPPPVVKPVDHEKAAAIERDAFAKGYAQGERAGLEAGTKRADAMLRRLGDTLQELSSLRRQIVQQTERQLVQLALAIARRVVKREFVIDEEFMTAIARIAMDRLGEATPATIRLHPQDHARVAAALAGKLEGAIEVVADPAVRLGGCLVESTFGFVDASVDAQFQELARTLLDGDLVDMHSHVNA